MDYYLRDMYVGFCLDKLKLNRFVVLNDKETLNSFSRQVMWRIGQSDSWWVEILARF